MSENHPGLKAASLLFIRIIAHHGFFEILLRTCTRLFCKSEASTHFNRVSPSSRGNLGTIEVSKMAHSGGKIRLCDRDVYPAITEGPANVFSSIPFLLVKARYDIKLKAFEVVVMYIS